MSNKVELLSPAGDFDSLKAAVQSGADSVYLGSELFNARISATNFSRDNLKEAIRYAKLRNVKVNFTLNTLLKTEELPQAIELASYVYSLGVDAILVQDLGLARYLINNFPDLEVHASTQMSVHNLEGVLQLEKLGFKRVVLARELSLHEIEYICNNSHIEIETFIHGAMCISYSGQCLFSSMVGGRSGNRGTCAQACRLPYEIVEGKNAVLDKGYLLSPRDQCGLKYIPSLINAGVKCFKIEGRMKSPEYVATVTRIYRKYIDLAQSDEPYIIDDKDIKSLLQVFNRGGFSDGNFDNEPNTSYVYSKKPNNIGLLLGQISNYNNSKGLVTFKTQEVLSINDTVCVENEDHKYTVSELMIGQDNLKKSRINKTITIGRIKGNIKPGDKIYKITDYQKNKDILNFIKKKNKKIPLTCVVSIRKGLPLSMEITSLDKETGTYFSMSSTQTIDLIPIDAISNPISRERIVAQVDKTGDTPFEFKNIRVILDENSYIPKLSAINKLRRDCLQDLINQAISRFERKIEIKKDFDLPLLCEKNKKNVKYSLQLNKLNLDYDYSKLSNIDRIYIPIRYFQNKDYSNVLNILKEKGDLYISTPIILKDNYRNLTFNSLDDYIKQYNIKGMIISNISGTGTLIDKNKNLELIANHSLNVFNILTINQLKNLGVKVVTLSPELDKNNLQLLANNSTIPTELMVYGRVPLMSIGYCLLGKTNRCYPTCNMLCKQNDFYLRDRLGYNFKLHFDRLQTITTIYNSKILSIKYDNFNIDYAKICIFEENIDEINKVIDTVKKGEIFKGEDYTSGNLNRQV